MAWPSGAISALPCQLFLFPLLHPLSSSQQAGTGENLAWEEGVKDADADEGWGNSIVSKEQQDAILISPIPSPHAQRGIVIIALHTVTSRCPHPTLLHCIIIIIRLRCFYLNRYIWIQGCAKNEAPYRRTDWFRSIKSTLGNWQLKILPCCKVGKFSCER